MKEARGTEKTFNTKNGKSGKKRLGREKFTELIIKAEVIQ